MDSSKLKVALMIGSIRKERSSHKPAEALITLLKERGVEPMVLDLQELDLPVFDDGIDHEGKTKLLDVYKNMDGIILVAPEYNHGISSSIKNAIDFAREKELMNKPMTVVTVSAGGFGGVRGTDHIRQVWFGVGGAPVPPTLPTSNVMNFDAENPPEKWLESANKFIDGSLKWFGMIKEGMSE